MPQISGEVLSRQDWNKVSAAKIQTDAGITDVRFWQSAAFADAIQKGATVTLELEKRAQRDDPEKFDAFIVSCNGVGDRPNGGGGNRPGGGGGRPQENPKDKTAVMLTSYAKDMAVHLSMPMDEAALAVTTAFLQIRTAIGPVVNT